MPAVIERWSYQHPRFADLRAVIAAEGQTDYFTFTADWHRSSYALAALADGMIVGFLRFVVQEIGPDNDQPPVLLNGTALTEAKILAFGVVESARNQGFGRQLQQGALSWAHDLGCYQARSHSDGVRQVNHHLKLSLGFAVHPVVRGNDDRGAYFIMPLHKSASEAEPQ